MTEATVLTPNSLHSLKASTVLSTVNPLPMSERVLEDPDSTPKYTVWHPAAFISSNVSLSIVSTLALHPHVTFNPLLRISLQISLTLRRLSVNKSSTKEKSVTP
ncbi:MAG: hypothetical protein DRJ69_03235 [Thermoprotei archaeon]|nr:MAG: hypothetical protein DRJ69_03235 [Thermoprotei archaeon]